MREAEIRKEERELRKLINHANQELDTLKLAKQSFLDDRQKEAEERVKAVLELSEAALDVAYCEYQELGAIRNEIGNVVSELISYGNELKASHEAIKQREVSFNERMDARLADVKRAEIKAKSELDTIKGQWAEITKRESMLKDEFKRVRDERAKLSAALKLK